MILSTTPGAVVKVRFSEVIQRNIGQPAVLEVQADSLRDLVQKLIALDPKFEKLLSGPDKLAPHHTFFINEDNVRQLQNLDSPLRQDDVVSIVQAWHGG